MKSQLNIFQDDTFVSKFHLCWICHSPSLKNINWDVKRLCVSVSASGFLINHFLLKVCSAAHSGFGKKVFPICFPLGSITNGLCGLLRFSSSLPV